MNKRSSSPTANKRLRQRYLLVVAAPFARDPQGRVWLDELWWHDLLAHLDYLANLTVMAPFREIDAPEPGMVEAVAPAGLRLAFVGLYPEGGTREVLLHLPRAIRVAWNAIGQADLVHSGVAGWPIPPGAIINPIALLRRKPLIIVVESAFWRLQPGAPAPWKARLRAWLGERFARWSLRHADFAVYTHRGYRQSLPVGPKGTAMVLPASWISERDILSATEAEALWDAKPLQARFLLATRLVQQKGVALFLEAMRLLERNGEHLEVDVIGDGEMGVDIQHFAEQAHALKVRLLEPRPYGQPFLQLLRNYHATIVPLTGDEQARILYDSFAQAVPVIATDTCGNREVVTDGGTGVLFETNNPEALVRAVTSCAQDRGGLRRMGLSALRTAAEHTHADMHRKRAVMLRELFGTG
ncbi:glycosyltransferase [Pseudomonas citronellolis]|uniref:glycosyltransferase n=1 Tax=Pseudomonas citronellolis TaxID=53408 RepID=UPI0023E40C82|nr:glycosyltransferase [Pseudomonas citronellolis]MDF3932894.1 glycosyltransferase [Pseudomonas citronellolis]